MRIHLSGVFVDDQQKALRFYTETLGFQLKHNIPFLQRVLDAQPFIDGNYDVTLTDGLLKA